MFSDMPKIELKGETYVEKVLWANPSPTSAFSNSTITLTESIASYDYLKIIYKSRDSANDQFSLIVSVSDFRTTLGDNLNPKVRLDAKISSSAAYSRAFYYSSDTVINLASVNASQIGGTGYSTYYCIPVKIAGLKKVGESGGNSNFVLICSKKQISSRTSSSYLTPISFDKNITSGMYLLWKITWVDASSTNIETSVIQYNGSGTYSVYGKYISSATNAPTLDSVVLTDSGITSCHYSGSWYDAYVEIYDVSSLFV